MWFDALIIAVILWWRRRKAHVSPREMRERVTVFCCRHGRVGYDRVMEAVIVILEVVAIVMERKNCRASARGERAQEEGWRLAQDRVGR